MVATRLIVRGLPGACAPVRRCAGLARGSGTGSNETRRGAAPLRLCCPAPNQVALPTRSWQNGQVTELLLPARKCKPALQFGQVTIIR